jgi:hypothetical protein
VSKDFTMPVSYDEADVRRACARKSAFTSERDARASARRVMDFNPYAEVVAYGCHFCGSWHIGRKSGMRLEPELDDVEPATVTEEEPLRRRPTYGELRRAARRRTRQSKGLQ